MFQDILKKIFGTKHDRTLKKLRPMVSAINDFEPRVEKLDDDGIRRRIGELREEIENGRSLDDCLPEVFAITREGARRTLGMRHYDVQLIGGIVLHQGKIAEMKTGEGKTLVATLPCVLNALEGKGVHVVTVNDYLATRDCEWMSKLYNFLGLTTGVIVPRQSDEEKKRAYEADITYGQNNEFGFDYMRDNMKFSIYQYAQRTLHYAIVDEVDSILVDEARTPLIISGPGEEASAKYGIITQMIPRLRKDEHYQVDEKAHSATLTEEGIELCQRMLGDKGLLEGANLYDPVNLESLHILNKSLYAHALYKKDQHYMVKDGQVLIIDEFTGRTLPGRRWSDGLHQAVEAKENVQVKSENRTLATISFQNLFRLYEKLSGMTGTADTEAAEFHKIYELDVVVIPTNRPIARVDEEDLVYKTEREKFKAVSNEILDCHERGQPVLVGTTSVEKSEALARILKRANVPFNVLNAKQHEREAYVVAQAGKKGAVTVATNMAGRGTDIVLGGNPEMLARFEILARAHEEGDEELLADPDALEAKILAEQKKYEASCKKEKEEVIAAGGLAIIGTERHESRRIDNQLRGRSGRQGDPGHSRFYLSLEDDLMRIFAGDRIQGMMDKLGMEEDVPIEHKWVTRAVENAQKKVEERNFDIRKHLLEYDDVMNQQRKSIYALRKQVLEGEYRALPTEEEAKKGKGSERIVTKADETLRERVKPILLQMVQVHGSPTFAADTPPDEIAAWRQKAFETPPEKLSELRRQRLERDVYEWFGCRVPVSKKLAKEPAKALAFLEEEVALSLTEQRERLLDMVDEIVGAMVVRACPPKKHYEDWDLDALKVAYREQFDIDATGIEQLTEAAEIAKKLYDDAEAILLKKEQEITPERYLRFFRNQYLQEIDRQWLEQLSSMEQLRDGIGLRGYGQRDPKKEYKREGYDLFTAMLERVKSNVAANMFRARVVRDEDIEKLEAQRRREAERRLSAMRANHPTAPAGEGAAPQQALPDDAPAQSRAARRAAASRARRAGSAVAAAAKVQTVKRDKPKMGRNDPCWCGSGKKYKQCHYREDQAADAAAEPEPEEHHADSA
ncbi:MAG: preprotein translocase subunit SecA [Sandaracinaceae bacterium]|nr:preprotein translocase subunit SecA [Sandaracinaceae bacterium]